jgi:hypothetical protein
MILYSEGQGSHLAKIGPRSASRLDLSDPQAIGIAMRITLGKRFTYPHYDS